MLPSDPALHTSVGIVSTSKRNSCSLIEGATSVLLSWFDTDQSHVLCRFSNETRLLSSSPNLTAAIGIRHSANAASSDSDAGLPPGGAHTSANACRWHKRPKKGQRSLE